MEEAKPFYEESLQLRTVVYGEKSIKVAESKQNLATILDSQGRRCAIHTDVINMCFNNDVQPITFVHTNTPY